MNLAGPIAHGIFALTLVTIVGALVSYATFKARDRSRRRKARANASAEPDLVFFVEHRVDEPAPAAVAPRTSWLRVVARFAAILFFLGGATAAVLFVLGPGARMIETSSAATKSVPRALPVRILGRPAPRAASLFVTPDSDLDRNGQIDAKERALIAELTPQFVMITSDDNGDAAGLEWIEEQGRTRGLSGALTFFNTGDYLSGRAHDMGRDVDPIWQQLARDSYIGLHGTTHAPGGEKWDLERWKTEHSTVQNEIMHRLEPPPGVTWDRYPFGSRAPFMAVDEAYFAGLDALDPAVVYDSSLQTLPIARDVDLATEVRDLPWPFTLDQAIPPEMPDAPKLMPHQIWEVATPAWRLRPASGAQWVTSMDVDLFRVYPCSGTINQAAVDDVLANFDAHYRGNRSPFHVGLHAQTYGEGHACERATMAAIFDGLVKKRAEGADLQFVSIPDLLAWLDHKRR